MKTLIRLLIKYVSKVSLDLWRLSQMKRKSTLEHKLFFYNA